MPLLFFDSTRSARWKHRSGLGRVGGRLLQELQTLFGDRAVQVCWSPRKRTFIDSRSGAEPNWQEGVFFTPEVFAESDRPGFAAWLESTACAKAALFHDAIPLRYPEFTWPRSVARHPYYMRQLLRFDLVLAVSRDAADELQAYWRWIGDTTGKEAQVLQLGADFAPGAEVDRAPQRKMVLLPGILEPRKGQDVAMRAMERVWADHPDAELHLAGRLNPHFGSPIQEQLYSLKREGARVFWHKKVDDRQLLELFQAAQVVILPSRAEGYGLGVIEALWLGRPVIASSFVPAAKRWAGRGVTILDALEPVLLAKAIELIINNPQQTPPRALIPSWKDSARQLADYLGVS